MHKLHGNACQPGKHRAGGQMASSTPALARENQGMDMKMNLQQASRQYDAPHPADITNPAYKRRAQWLACAGSIALALTIATLYAAFAPSANGKTGAVELNGTMRTPIVPTPTPVLIEVASQAGSDGGDMSIQISQYTQLQVGDDYPAVEQLQNQLSALGYFDLDEPSTVYSSALADAVSMFQRVHGLEVNGSADAAVQEKLFDDQALIYQVHIGDEGDDVCDLQEGLARLGYFSGKVTGYFGTATEAAVRAFQQNNGLEADGIFHADDREVLYSPQAKTTAIPATVAPESTPKPTATPNPTKAPEATKAPEKTKTPEKAQESQTADTAAPIVPELPEDTVLIPGLDDAAAFELSVEQPDEPEAEPTEQEQETGGKGGSSDTIEGIIRTALDQLGKPYRRGNEGPNSYDCSGLVYYCLTKNGVSIGRYSAASYAKVSSWKKITKMSNLQRGDLIFFHDESSSSVSHVGICLGDGTMVDASSSKSQIVHRSHTTSYWKSNFVCGRRIF